MPGGMWQSQKLAFMYRNFPELKYRQAACSWSFNLGCTCSYLHLNSVFTSPHSLAFPFMLPYRFHHTNFFRATADLIWTSPGFSSHSASLCQVVWILHTTDLPPQWIFTSDIQITAHNLSCPSLIEYNGRTGRRVSVDTVVMRKTSWGSCAPHIFL